MSRGLIQKKTVEGRIIRRWQENGREWHFHATKGYRNYRIPSKGERT